MLSSRKVLLEDQFTSLCPCPCPRPRAWSPCPWILIPWQHHCYCCCYCCCCYKQCYWLTVVVCFDVVWCRQHIICCATIDVSPPAWVDIRHWTDSSVSTHSDWWRTDRLIWGTRWDCNRCWLRVVRASMYSWSWCPAECVSSLVFNPGGMIMIRLGIFQTLVLASICLEALALKCSSLSWTLSSKL